MTSLHFGAVLPHPLPGDEGIKQPFGRQLECETASSAVAAVGSRNGFYGETSSNIFQAGLFSPRLAFQSGCWDENKVYKVRGNLGIGFSAERWWRTP